MPIIDLAGEYDLPLCPVTTVQKERRRLRFRQIRNRVYWSSEFNGMGFTIQVPCLTTQSTLIVQFPILCPSCRECTLDLDRCIRHRNSDVLCTSCNHLTDLDTATRSTLLYLRHTPEGAAKLEACIKRKTDRVLQAQQRKERASGWLKQWLTPQQQKDFDALERFQVIGSLGTTAYLIRYGNTTQRISIYDEHKVEYCAHPPLNYAAEDIMLTQKLMIETDEPTFLRIANVVNRTQPITTSNSMRDVHKMASHSWRDSFLNRRRPTQAHTTERQNTRIQEIYQQLLAIEY